LTKNEHHAFSEKRYMPTILVVDDDPVVRKLLALVLEEEGFQVLIAKDGPDALRIAESNPGEVDLLVSDVRMPGMDGPSLARTLRAADPALPVLLVSGDCEDAPQHGGTPLSVLSKPFSLPLLLRMVRHTVRRRAAIPTPAGCRESFVD
jgi:two-component system cell cycle sensor histidine kinase/response regulator CckA